MNADRATSGNDFQTGPGREVLLEMIVEVVALSENVGEIAVIDVEIIANSRPVHPLHLSCDQAKHYDDHDQENSPRANAGSTSSLALGALVFQQFDDAPKNKQKRPVVGEQVRQP